FTPSNIGINGQSIAFFDFEPPKSMHKDFDWFYKNKNYVDLASFILWIWICEPFREPWRYFKSKRRFIKEFLGGYEMETNFRVNTVILKQYLRVATQSYCKLLIKRGGDHRLLLYAKVGLIQFSIRGHHFNHLPESIYA